MGAIKECLCLGALLAILEISVKLQYIFYSPDNILSIGEWSRRGCSRNANLSNTFVTVCECTHLTHFAILLSASPPNFSDPVALSLEIIGYVGVSISLVAMALTITTFSIVKYVYSMHCLCVHK